MSSIGGLVLAMIGIGLLKAPPRAQAQAPLSFDLRSAVRYALDHAPVLDSTRKLDASSVLSAKNAIAAFLPSLDFSTTDGAQGSVPVAVPGTGPWETQAQLSLSETLYDNGTSIINRQLALVAEQVAGLTDAKTRDQTALNVIQAYYQFSLLTQLLTVQEQQYKLEKDQYDRAAIQYRQGFTTRQDFLRFKTDVQRAELALMDSRRELRQAEAQLKRDLAGPTGDDVAGSTFVPLAITPITDAIPGAPSPVSHSYDYRIAEAQKESNRLNVEVADRKYWPQLTVSGNATQSAFSNYPGQTGINGNYLSWNAQALLQFNLWDWGTRRRNVEISQLAADSSNDSYADGVLEIKRAIEANSLEMSELDDSYKLTSELLRLSEESFNLIDEQYHLGQATYLDVSTGLSNLLDAKVRFYTNHFNLLRDLAQYRFYDGTLYDFIAKL